MSGEPIPLLGLVPDFRISGIPGPISAISRIHFKDFRPNFRDFTKWFFRMDFKELAQVGF